MVPIDLVIQATDTQREPDHACMRECNRTIHCQSNDDVLAVKSGSSQGLFLFLSQEQLWCLHAPLLPPHTSYILNALYICYSVFIVLHMHVYWSSCISFHYTSGAARNTCDV